MFSLFSTIGKVSLIMLWKPATRTLASALALALFASACVQAPAPTPSTLPAITTIDPETSTISAPVTTSPQDATQAALRAQIDELIETTEDLRELDFLEPPMVTIVTDEELAARVRQQIEEELDPDDLARDAAVQVLLGLIGPEVDLLDLYTDLYSEQVAGYYDGELEELVVPAGVELSGIQKMTLVHELVHALTDQHFAFDDVIEQLDDEDRFDELSALQAVIEGDASFTELLYVTELSTEEKIQIVTESLDQDTAVFNQTPRFIQELLFFPYIEGSEFVQSLWSTDTGFDLVNEAYAVPPTTTEQIYHPETYRNGEGARTVALPEIPLAGYEVGEEAVWGQVSFRVMFEQGLGADTAEPAAAGWGGDRYRVMWDGEDVAYALLYTGDTNQDAAEMYDALVAYAASAMNVGEPDTHEGTTSFSGDDYAYVTLSADRVLFIASSDPDAGPFVLAAFSDF
jgi:hypothetical protein